MLEIVLDETTGIATLHPGNALTQADFEYAAKRIDDFLESSGNLKGIIINTRDFPGWESFDAMLSHFRFIHDHHRQIPKVAFVTDSAIGTLADKVADHFVKARIKHFAFDDLKDAERWIQE
jgi:hypothetical protein